MKKGRVSPAFRQHSFADLADHQIRFGLSYSSPDSHIYETHHCLGVPSTRRAAFGRHFIEARNVLLCKPDLRSGRVLFEVTATLRAGYGDNIFALSQHPRQRKLPGCHSLLASDLGNPSNQLQVLCEVVSLEPW